MDWHKVVWEIVAKAWWRVEIGRAPTAAKVLADWYTETWCAIRPR